MLFSFCTPSHKSQYLTEAYRSLQAMDVPEGVQWEWILVLNGEPLPDPLLTELQQDNRVRIYKSQVQARQLQANKPDTAKFIGELKKEAFLLARGEWLIEFDHDDLAFPILVRRMTELCVKHPKAGFISSDNVHLLPDGSCEIFSKSLGWQKYPAYYPGLGQLQAQSHFPTNPASLQSIGTCVDHVRAWRKEVYESLEGHNTDLLVCDDMDLVCRTYLAGYEMVHAQEPLYLYRCHEENSYKLHQKQVHNISYALGDKYRIPMVHEWCRRNDYCMLDLGGAFNCPPGYKSVDLRNADYVCDIVKDGLPPTEKPIGCIRAADFMEHVPSCSSRCAHKECVVGVMNNIYDRLVPGGWLLLDIPSDTGRGASQDPTHGGGSRWNTNSLWYYCHDNWRRFVHGMRAKFIAHRVVEKFPSSFHEQHNIPYVIAHLTADKGQHEFRPAWPI